MMQWLLTKLSVKHSVIYLKYVFNGRENEYFSNGPAISKGIIREMELVKQLVLEGFRNYSVSIYYRNRKQVYNKILSFYFVEQCDICSMDGQWSHLINADHIQDIGM